jgi:hypothetical protein
MEINLQKYSPKYICTCVKINLYLVPTKCKFRYGDFVKFKDISFPGDFDKDLVHYSPSGMKKYVFRIRRIFLESGFVYFTDKILNILTYSFAGTVLANINEKC